MNKGEASGLETVKRTDTAELRRRYAEITRLLGEGYNNKQICEHLNMQGLAIPYAQYRAIMSRLRRETGASDDQVTSLTHLQRSKNYMSALPVNAGPLLSLDRPDGENMKEKKILWDPKSEVKWK